MRKNTLVFIIKIEELISKTDCIENVEVKMILGVEVNVGVRMKRGTLAQTFRKNDDTDIQWENKKI